MSGSENEQLIREFLAPLRTVQPVQRRPGSQREHRSIGLVKLAATALGGFALLAAITLLAHRPPPSTKPAVPGSMARIAFVYNGDIWGMNSDGSGRRRLVSNSDVYQPVWSPDRTRIVYSGPHSLWLINPDGSARTRLTGVPTQGPDGPPAWSPDGSQITYTVQTQHSKPSLWVMNADGSGQREIVANISISTMEAWSPDGTRIAFDRESRSRRQEVWVTNADGSHQRRLAAGRNSQSYQPAWSPDGTKIAYFNLKWHTGLETLWVMNADGSHKKRLSLNPNAFVAQAPAWSPDGRRIAFVGGLHSEIMVVNSDGSDERQLTNASGSAQNDPTAITSGPHVSTFSWSPDGNSIAYTVVEDIESTAFDGSASRIWVMNADGSSQRPLTNTFRSRGGVEPEPVWLPPERG